MPLIFLPAKRLSERGEGDMLVSDVGPMNSFEIGVFEKSSGMSLKGIELIIECRELEPEYGDSAVPRCPKALFRKGFQPEAAALN